MRRAAAAWLFALLVLLAAPALARADADPASDMLYTGELFLPYTAKVSPGAESALLRAIGKSRTVGKEVRVALIADKGDLGGVPQLFGKPIQYTRFLGSEVQFVYAGRVLVVMPQGAGLAKGGHLIADQDVIAARPGPGGDGLARTAAKLVLAISGAGPATRVTPTPRPSQSISPYGTTTVAAPAVARKKGGVPAGLAAGIAIGIVALILAVGGVILARRGRRAT